jgi:hypothetical protein
MDIPDNDVTKGNHQSLNKYILTFAFAFCTALAGERLTFTHNSHDVSIILERLARIEQRLDNLSDMKEDIRELKEELRRLRERDGQRRR